MYGSGLKGTFIVLVVEDKSNMADNGERGLKSVTLTCKLVSRK